jgi:hypothetical protein
MAKIKGFAPAPGIGVGQIVKQCNSLSYYYLLLSLRGIVDADDPPLSHHIHSRCIFSNPSQCHILLHQVLHLGVVADHKFVSNLRHLHVLAGVVHFYFLLR